MHAAATDKYKSEMATTKRDLLKRLDSVKKDSKQQAATPRSDTEVQHKLDMKVAEVHPNQHNPALCVLDLCAAHAARRECNVLSQVCCIQSTVLTTHVLILVSTGGLHYMQAPPSLSMQVCYYKVEIQAVKAEAEQLRKMVEKAQESTASEEQKLELVEIKHAEQLDKLTSELEAVKGEFAHLSQLESEIKQQELESAVQAAVAAAELRCREEEALRREELLAQVCTIAATYVTCVIGYKLGDCTQPTR